MPRSRMSQGAKVAKTLNVTGSAMSPTKKGPGRPRKKKLKVENLPSACVTPVANGYVVTSEATGTEMFVFEDLDKAFEFLRATLVPTVEQTAFMESV